jgi:hypothetical protein
VSISDDSVSSSSVSESGEERIDALGTLALHALTLSPGPRAPAYVGAGVTLEAYVGGLSLCSELRSALAFDERNLRRDMVDSSNQG